MLLETLRIALVGALLVVLPGFLLVQALLPPGRVGLGRLERAFLILAGGVTLVTLVGLFLGFLPHEERGRLSTFATGAPNAEILLLGVCAVLFYVGLARGAYPRLAARFPQLVPSG